MPLPDSIPVKYSEDDAQFISIRPLVRQTFRPAELIDMIVSVAGKDPARVRQILRSGTIVFNSYRYWWDALDSAEAELENLLAGYPDAQPSRPFHAQDCEAVLLESPGTPPRHSLRLTRSGASRKRLFRTRSLWDALMDLTREREHHPAPAYREYSYAQRADLYTSPLDSAAIAHLIQQAAQYAPRQLRLQLAVLSKISHATFLCPRYYDRAHTPNS
ncbi:MAG: hypothetical protein WB987_13565 [Candidatus Acidiferrales bacterium]